MLYQGQHNRLSHGDTALYITTAIYRIRSRFRSRIRSRIRSSVDVAGAAAVAAVAASAAVAAVAASAAVAAVAASAASAAVAAVAAVAAGTTKQPIYLFLTLILVRCCVIDFNCTCASCITHCVAMCGIPYTVRPLLAKVVYPPEIVLRPRRSLPCSVYIVEYTVA
jgi:hypothetical protein